MATEGQERCGEVPAAAATPPAMARWLGPPTRQEEGRTFYAAFEAGGQQFTLGDAVYLRPAQPGLAPFVAKLESLHQVEQDGSMLVGVKWFYRPTEIEVGHEVSVEQNEVFCSDDFATHPLSAVCGKCDVLTPAQVDRCLGSSTTEPAGADTFVCSRKYIQAEGRIVPMDDGMAWVSLTAALQEKPFAVVGGKVVQRGSTAEDKAAVQPRPKRVRPTSAADGAAAPVPGEQQQQQGQQRGKRRRRPRGTHSPEPHAPATTATAAAAQAPRDEGGSSDHLPSTSAMTDGSQHSGGTAGGSRRTATTSRSRAGKATTGRWIKDRYDAAQQSLVAVMRRLGATAADCAILRPTLREEARKAVGDTGLLDHLLKHMADQVVGPSGDRLRRRHNKDGHMVYWLQSPAEAEQEEQALREEMETLRSELAEVKEARRVLHAVRGEAAQAIQAVSGIRERPEEVVKSLSVVAAQVQGIAAQAHVGDALPHPMPAAGTPTGGVTRTGSPAPVPGTVACTLAATLLSPGAAAPAVLHPGEPAADLMQRAQVVGSQAQALLKRLQVAEILAQAGGETALGEAAQMARLLSAQLVGQLAALADVARDVSARCVTLEHQVAALAEEGQGRYEALAASLATANSLRMEAASSQARIGGLEREVAAMKAALAALAGIVHNQPAVRAELLAAAAGCASPSGDVDKGLAGPAPARSLAAAPRRSQQLVGQDGVPILPFQTSQPPAQQQHFVTPPSLQAGLQRPGTASSSGGLTGAGVAVPQMAAAAASAVDPFMQQQQQQAQQRTAPGPAAPDWSMGQPAMLQHPPHQMLLGAGILPAPGMPGMPFQLPHHLHLQQPQQQAQPGPRRAAHMLMPDPRFAQVLMQQHAGSSSVSSGSTGAQPPAQCNGTGRPLLVAPSNLAPKRKQKLQ